MKTLMAPRNSFSRSAASIPALLALITLSGTALAATEIETPCPETSSDALHSFIERDADTSPIIKMASDTVAKEPVAEAEDTESADDADGKDAPKAEFTTRLPRSATNELPGFRRHMYRTDI